MKRARTSLSKENRKQFILDCAERIIIEEGLSGLNLQNVSKKSNLAIGTIYLYFSKKEDLIAQLTLKSRQILLAAFRNSVVNEPDALKQLVNLLYSYYHFYLSNPHYNQLVSFFETNAGLAESEELLAASMQINAIVVEIIKLGKRQKTVRDDIDEFCFSFLLWGATVGIIQLIEVKKHSIESVLNLDGSELFSKHIKMIINSIEKEENFSGI